MRHCILVVGLFCCSATGAAQLAADHVAAEELLPLPVLLQYGVPTCGPAPLPVATAQPPQPQVFDFAAAKPHLAFFCRLELNIEEATRFPVRFRLGEVRTWQQELSKRD